MARYRWLRGPPGLKPDEIWPYIWRARGGDTQAVDRLTSHWTCKMYRNLGGKFPRLSPEDREDIIQGVLLDLFEPGGDLHQLDPDKGQPDAYVLKMAAHGALDLCRRHERHARLTPAAEQAPISPGALIEDRDLAHQIVERARVQAGGPDLLVFQLSQVDQGSCRDIERALGISKSEVGRKVARTLPVLLRAGEDALTTPRETETDRGPTLRSSR